MISREGLSFAVLRLAPRYDTGHGTNLSRDVIDLMVYLESYIITRVKKCARGIGDLHRFK